MVSSLDEEELTAQFSHPPAGTSSTYDHSLHTAPSVNSTIRTLDGTTRRMAETVLSVSAYLLPVSFSFSGVSQVGPLCSIGSILRACDLIWLDAA